MCRKLLAYRNTIESIPGINQYRAISVKFIAQGNNGLSLTGFEPMWLAILRLLIRHVNHSTTPPLTPLSLLIGIITSFKILIQVSVQYDPMSFLYFTSVTTVLHYTHTVITVQCSNITSAVLTHMLSHQNFLTSDNIITNLLFLEHWFFTIYSI